MIRTVNLGIAACMQRLMRIDQVPPKHVFRHATLLSSSQRPEQTNRWITNNARSQFLHRSIQGSIMHRVHTQLTAHRSYTSRASKSAVSPYPILIYSNETPNRFRVFTAGAAASLVFWAYIGQFTIQHPDAFAWWVGPLGVVITICFLPMLGLQAGRHIARIERVSPSEYNISTHTIFGGLRTATVDYSQIDGTHPSNQTTSQRPRSPMGFLRIGKRTGLFMMENKGKVHNAQELLQILPTAKLPENTATPDVTTAQPIPLPAKRPVNVNLPPRYGPKPNTMRVGKK